MRHGYWSRLSRVFLVLAIIGVISAIPKIVSATCYSDQQSCSTTYGVSQPVFNSGGVNQCPLHSGTPSSTYCANISVGDLADGNTKSGNQNQAQAGSAYVTNREPYIQATMNSAPFSFSSPLSTTCTSTATGDFTVETYLAGGYVVQTEGNPPTSTGANPHTLATNTTPTTPAIGTEQFGMNLVANTGNMPNNCTSPPNSLGADPVQQPDTSFSFGAAAGSAQNPGNSDAYNQTGKFMYRNGDVIAYSNSSSGVTSYTISYIYNISGITPDGQYSFNDVIVATSTY